MYMINENNLNKTCHCLRIWKYMLTHYLSHFSFSSKPYLLLKTQSHHQSHFSFSSKPDLLLGTYPFQSHSPLHPPHQLHSQSTHILFSQSSCSRLSYPLHFSFWYQKNQQPCYPVPMPFPFRFQPT